MNAKLTKTITAIFIVLALLAAGLMAVKPAAAAAVEPELVPDNPSCEDLGYDFGVKWDYPENSMGGTYPLGNGYVTWSTDGTFVDWTSTIGVDAVIMKGGPNANVYVYDPPAESFGDDDLVSPDNASGGPAGLSHVEFCFDYEVMVEKTAETSFTRTWNWTIDKSVTPDTWDLFTGDSGTSEYTVEVTKTGPFDSDWEVEGVITIFNPAPMAAMIESVTDMISGFGSVDVVCEEELPYELMAGDTLKCSYETALPDGTNRTNTATVVTSGMVGGGSDDADVIFGKPTTLVNDTINVDDTVEGDLGSFSDSGSVSYERIFTCDADEGSHGNTATIVETGASDSADVMVNCYALDVTKDAETALTRTWTWDIDKVGDQSKLTLSVGQTFLVNYDVTVSAMSADSDWAVSGTIQVENPAPIDAVLNSVSDVVSPAIAATVDCGVTFPYTLVAGGTLTCSYSADLPNALDRTNTATATLQNYAYDSAGVGTASGTTDFSGTANVDFSTAEVTKVDECIDVTDTLGGVLGTVCANQAPKTFEYTYEVGPYAECGTYDVDNIASFETNDTGSTGEAFWKVIVNVPCQGCTLTPGYWKTHSKYGPAKYDDNWMKIGEDTTFFLSGQSYYQVLWTSPSGNAYYILAHAYIAAKLNILDGASSTPEVDTAISWAEAFFSAKSPSAKLSKSEKADVVYYATLLDNYNNGLTGPGHCSW